VESGITSQSHPQTNLWQKSSTKTYWQQPEKNSIPKTITLAYKEDLSKAEMGLAIEGSDSSWTGKSKVNSALPSFNYYTNKPHYFELFNKAKGNFSYEIKAPAFVKIKDAKGEINDEKRIWLNIDWEKAPASKSKAILTVLGSDGSKITFQINIDNRRFLEKNIVAFVPDNGYIAMEAPNFSRSISNRPFFWKNIPNYGKTLGGMMPVPVTTIVQKLDQTTPHLEYDIFINDIGTFELNSFISPTIDFANGEGLKFAISVDDEAPVTVNISSDYKTEAAWRKSVADNIKIFKTPLKFSQTGKHTIKYWMVSPGVVLQKLILNLGGLKPSFLGPQETFVSEIK
jgi:hypothetical protein